MAAESRTGDKPTTALYVGDWDPSGLHMSEIDLPERIDRYGGSVHMQRVALTRAHVEQGDLLSFRADEKKNDPRYRWFVERYGRTCWELDALSPVILRRDVEDAIYDYLDLDAWTRADVTERAERESLKSILDRWPGISGQASK